jgi:hypothetical protein
MMVNIQHVIFGWLDGTLHWRKMRPPVKLLSQIAKHVTTSATVHRTSLGRVFSGKNEQESRACGRISNSSERT